MELWQKILKSNFTNWQRLADFLGLSDEQRAWQLHEPAFPLNLPYRLAQKIAKGTLDDPILKQFLPTKSEEEKQALFMEDPVEDARFRKEPKLLQKYRGRSLLLSTSACAMHCRYCFRQNFDYSAEAGKLFDKELQAIAKDSSIHEVILSGGDPLSLTNEKLKELVASISAIPHISRIRFHTRFPIGIPERIDGGFLNMLKESVKQIWFVIHANHPKELDEEIFSALKAVQKTGSPVLNQSVLLKGVNDEPDILADLCEDLADRGVMPYYLHQLDRVRGAHHFEVSEEEGKRLIEEISARLPGYAVPKYVREIPEAHSKSFI